MENKEIFCSLVIPCYNEEANIVPLVEGFASVPAADLAGFELILVENGSSDGSAAVLAALLPRFPFLRAVAVPVNKGYGYGISQGLKAARGLYAGWAHGDMQYGPAAIMLAVRSLPAAPGEKVFLKGLRSRRSFSDSFFTAGMSLFETVLFQHPVSDINAQPTLFHRSLLDYWEGAPLDFSLDLYAFVMALEHGFMVKRVPMELKDRAAGVSSWNKGLSARLKLVLAYIRKSLAIRRGL